MPEIHLGEALRLLRQKRELSLRSLAERTGFSASFLSQVENGQASPSLASMERIAAALNVSLGQFFGGAETTAPAVVLADARPTLNSGWSKARLEALGTGGSATRLDPVLVTLRPGGASGKRAYPSTKEEFALIVEGTIVLTLGEKEQVLHSGDAVTIQIGMSRRWQNLSEAPVRIVIVSVR